MAKIDPSFLAAFRDDASESLAQWERACLAAKSTPVDDTYMQLLRSAHNMKGNAGLIGFEGMKEAIHRLEDCLIDMQKAGVSPGEPNITALLLGIESFLRDWIDQIAVNPEYKPDNLNILAQLEVSFSTQNVQSAGAKAKQAEGDEGSRKEKVQMGGGAAKTTEDTIRINAAKVDRLIQYVGELTLAQAIVSRARVEGRLDSVEVRDAISQCDKIVQSIRMSALDLRMLPLTGLFKRLERGAMELSVRLQKPVRFISSGEDVSMDKLVIERIFEPLLHIVRNALDHGLESPDDRKVIGKDPAGMLQISAQHGATGVIISIKDDGKGLDAEKITRRGKEMGLVTDGQVIDSSGIYSLIFKPGFSTAEEVTDISGRGMGLDVVEKEVNRLGGQIIVSSTVGKGTEFNISLPTNISLIDVLIVQVGGVKYAVPTQDLTEILNLNEYPLQGSFLYEKMIRLRDNVVPVEDLSKFLPSAGVTPDTSFVGSAVSGAVDVNGLEGEPTSSALLIDHKAERVAFEVDAILGQQQAFVRPLKGYLGTLPWVTGATVLANGEPSLILNLIEMAKDYFSGTVQGVRSGNPAGREI